MSNRIKYFGRLNEEQAQAQTQAQAQPTVPQKTSNTASELIKANPVEGYNLALEGDNLSVESPSGYKFMIPKDSLDFYKQLFDDGVEHIGNYERHGETIEAGLASTDLSEIADDYKKLQKAFAGIEIKPDTNSVFAVLLANPDIQQDEFKRLYNAYATEKYEIEEADKKKLFDAIKHAVSYYKFILAMFEHFDK